MNLFTFEKLKVKIWRLTYTFDDKVIFITIYNLNNKNIFKQLSCDHSLKTKNGILTNLKMIMYYLVICALLSINCALNVPKWLELVEQVTTHKFIQAILVILMDYHSTKFIWEAHTWINMID